MRMVIQRVKSSRLEVGGEVISEIGVGLNVFVGVMKEDTIENAKRTAKRIASIRLFPDEDGKLNFNVVQAGAEILLVSNFTLCDRKGVSGARPDFSLSADKDKAKEYYLALQKELLDVYGIEAKMGRFAEDMQIYSQLDGPINLVQEY